MKTSTTVMSSSTYPTASLILPTKYIILNAMDTSENEENEGGNVDVEEGSKLILACKKAIFDDLNGRLA